MHYARVMQWAKVIVALLLMVMMMVRMLVLLLKLVTMIGLAVEPTSTGGYR